MCGPNVLWRCHFWRTEVHYYAMFACYFTVCVHILIGHMYINVANKETVYRVSHSMRYSLFLASVSFQFPCKYDSHKSSYSRAATYFIAACDACTWSRMTLHGTNCIHGNEHLGSYIYYISNIP